MQISYFKLKQLPSPGFVHPTLRRIDIVASKFGVPDSGYKELVVWEGFLDRAPIVTIPLIDGFTGGLVVDSASVDGHRAVLLYEYSESQLAAVRAIDIRSDIRLQIDINDGAGGGTELTDTATTLARVRVDRRPLPREVIAVEHKADGTWRYAGTTRINDTGLLELQVTGGDVYVMAADDYGAPFQPNLQIDVGATIRPSHFQGWLYRCTEAGRLPIDEPEWWPELGDNPARLVGTARLQAVRYYQPIAHGPIKYELV